MHLRILLPCLCRLCLCVAFALLVPRTGAKYCNHTCGAATVPYPFGFSGGCAIPLICNSTHSILVGSYPVRNITPESLLLDVLPSCRRPINAAVGELFGPNYAMTWKNGLFLRNCTASAAAASRCLIPISLATQISQREDLASCGDAGGNITCYSSGRTEGFLSPENVTATGCGSVFTSVLYAPGAGAQMPAIVFGAAELGWWLNGSCRCSPNATCTPVAAGFRCSCNEGFVGDGFADGDGCARAAAANCSASNKKKSGGCGGGGRVRVGVLIGGVIAGVSLLFGLAFLCSAARRKSAASKEQMKRLLLSETASCPVPLYSYKDMERATNSFADAYKLGTGAYATVYVGKLPEGLVAVKRIRCRDPNSHSSAMNEIRLISSVRHPNLVRLLGCCIDQGEQILVYEFVPNGTLAQHLRRDRDRDRDRRRDRGLSWRARLAIAADAARAVAYLHTALQPPIYHRDIKSTNILLDRDLSPKIADFGLSRTGMTETSHVSTAPQGTPGYLDPQYHQDFHLTDKSDVYSFGVVLVEMVTAMKVVDFERAPSEVNLAALALDRIGRGRVEEIVDPLLLLTGGAAQEWVMDSIRRVAELAFRCLAFHKDVRPSMTEVAEELELIRLSGPPPQGPLDEEGPLLQEEVGVEVEEEVEVDVEEGKEGIVGLGSEEVEKLKGKKRRGRGMRLKVVGGSGGGGRREEARADSPVSVQDVLWVSEQSSSPSTNGSMPRFVL